MHTAFGTDLPAIVGDVIFLSLLGLGIAAIIAGLVYRSRRGSL